eukprot:scaffold3451_cov116-Isochrysis_galbana.AAC.13
MHSLRLTVAPAGWGGGRDEHRTATRERVRTWLSLWVTSTASFSLTAGACRPKLDAHQTTAETLSNPTASGSVIASHCTSSTASAPSPAAPTSSARFSSSAAREPPHARTLLPGHRASSSATTSLPIGPSAPVTSTVSPGEIPGVSRTKPGASLVATAGMARKASDAACSAAPKSSSASNSLSVGAGGGGGGCTGALCASANFS